MGSMLRRLSEIATLWEIPRRSSEYCTAVAPPLFGSFLARQVCGGQQPGSLLVNRLKLKIRLAHAVITRRHAVPWSCLPAECTLQGKIDRDQGLLAELSR